MCIIFLVPVILFLLVSALFYIPAVQNAAVGVTAGYLSEKFRMEIRIENVRVAFPFHFSARNFYAVNRSNDTLFMLGKLTARVRLRPLLRGNISVRGITLEKLKINTSGLLDNILIKGEIGEACLDAAFVLPTEKTALISRFELQNADIDFCYCDTAAKDTTPTTTDWRIELGRIKFRNVHFSCAIPRDSIFIDAEIKQAGLKDGLVDLEKEMYKVLDFNTEITMLQYSADTAASPPHFDGKHLWLDDLKLSLNSFTYNNTNDFRAILRAFSVREKSGLYLKNMEGIIISDTSGLSIPAFEAITDHSHLQIDASIPWSIINNCEPCREPILLAVNGHLGKQDVMLLFAGASEDFRESYPDEDLTIDAVVSGTSRSLIVRHIDLRMTSRINMHLEGMINNVLKDSIRTGNLALDIRTGNLEFLSLFLHPDMRTRFRIPDIMHLNGNVKVNGGVYTTDLTFEEQSGEVCLSGKYNVWNENYELHLVIDSLRPVRFMPEDSLLLLNGSLRAAGKGIDIFNKRTKGEIKADITDMHFTNYRLTDLSLNATLQDNALEVEAASDSPQSKGEIVFKGTVKENDVRGILTVRMDTLDLKGLNLSDSAFSASFKIIAELETDLKRKHTLDIMLDSRNLTIDQQQIRSSQMALSFLCEEDTVRAGFNTGDLNIALTGNADPVTLAGKFRKLSEQVIAQFKKDSMIDIRTLQPDFPDMTFYAGSGNDNLLYDILQEYNIFYEAFSIDATVSPVTGLDADGILLALVVDTFKIDTFRVNIWQDTLGLRYNAGIRKNRFRNQEPFKASANGYLYNREADISVSYINRYNEKGLDLGINLKKTTGSFNFHLYPRNVVLGFIPFTLNDNNFFKFGNIQEMEADIHLEGNDNASFRIYSDRVDSTSAMKEMTVELNHINIEKTAAGFTTFRSLKGILNAMLRYRPDGKSYMIMAEGSLDSSYHENGRIGEMLFNATYMPVDNNKYQIDFHAFHNMSEFAALSLMYAFGHNKTLLDGVFTVDHLPLKMAGPFLPGNLIKPDGYINGSFNIGGTNVKPLVSGSLKFDSVSILAVPSSTHLTFENREITVKNNVIDIDRLKVFAKNTPFVIHGNINATNINLPTVNINISGSNLPLMDAKNTSGRMVYGKLFADINTTITGYLQSLRIRGNLNILGKSNMTYVMPGATFVTQDGFNNIVKFTYFSDTLPERNRRTRNFAGRSRVAAAMSGNDIFFSIRIEPLVWFNIDMDEEKKNYVKMKGGGDLAFHYTPQGDMLLNGRYILSDGNIRYNIPVIPLTDFIIRNGSYVDWSGDPMNPYLNITAYSRIRSSVKFDGQNRMVDFNAGIRINNYLDKMAMEFILEAPNDVNVQNQLASMGAEERSKQAISLLVAGIYLASGGTGTNNLDVNVALSSFIQRELKNIIGRFLGELPFTFDVLTYDGLFGLSRRIDYTGRLHTNLISDHFNTTLGLRYTTNDPMYGNMLILDDISFEYLLDTDDFRAVSLFGNREYKNIFEGEISKIGAGFTIRKKIKTLKDLFLKESNIKNQESR